MGQVVDTRAIGRCRNCRQTVRIAHGIFPGAFANCDQCAFAAHEMRDVIEDRARMGKIAKHRRARGLGDIVEQWEVDMVDQWWGVDMVDQWLAETEDPDGA